MNQKKYMSYNSQREYDNRIKEYIENKVQGFSDKSDIVKKLSGEKILISDSAKTPIQGLKLFGKTTQNTTTGKNLLKVDFTELTDRGITFSPTDDGGVSVTGTTQNYPFIAVGRVYLEEGKSYCASLTGIKQAKLSFRVVDREQTPVKVLTQNERTFSPTVSGWCLFEVTIDPNYNGSSLVYPQLELGTAVTEYEPYTGGIPSPNPDYPQELVSAGDGGSLGVKVAGKNLVPNDAGTVTNHGVTFTANDDGSVTLNGTSSGDWSANVRLSLQKYPAGKYIVSGCPKDRKGTNARIVVGSMDGAVATVETGNGSTIEIAEETELYFDIRTALGDVFNGMIFYPMMRSAASTDATYEPYKPVQTLPVSTPNGLPGIPVASGGNYTDETGQQWVCDEVDFGRGVYVQRVQHNIYCGNDEEAWYIADVTNNVYEELKKTGNVATVTASTGILPAISNKYISVSRNAIYTSTVTSGISNSAITKCIRVKDNRFTGTTSGEWAAWVAENPFEVIYKLATPNETPLSEIDPDALAQYAAMHTNYPNTTILNDCGAGMEVRYCTPLTSVPMVHGEADSGKVLAIDEHGCVTKIDMDDFGSGSIDVDFDISNDAEANLINADTLGGASASEYVKQEGIKDSLSIDLNGAVSGTAQPTNADMLGNVPAEEVFSELDGKLSMELLWENASPTSDFGAQTITLDLSGCSAVVVQWRFRSFEDSDGIITTFVGRTDNGKEQRIYGGFFSEELKAYPQSRCFTVQFDSNSITFTNSKLVDTIWNSAFIPRQIYGIKGVSA